MTFNNPGLKPPAGYTDCLICGRIVPDNVAAIRRHMERCDAWGDAR